MEMLIKLSNTDRLIVGDFSFKFFNKEECI